MSSKPSRSPLAIGMAISMVLVVTFGGLYFLFWKGPKEVAGATKDGAIEVANAGYDLFKLAGGDLYRALGFEPEVTIAGETVHKPASPIAEIATAEKDFSHTYEYEVKWAGSTKRLKLKGDFTAKAGFKEGESFQVEISADGEKLILRHGKPELLSCELKKFHILADENGWWNKIKDEERENAQNSLLRRARQRALSEDLQNAATHNLLNRLEPLREKFDIETESQLIP